ncbi:MAG: outer membrane protein assembly factor BamB [Pirellulaceae bacterium]|jgi:outer membrane protein assembly factor BamB
MFPEQRHNLRRICFVALICCTHFASSRLAVAQWSAFRGGRLQAVADAQNLPTKWSQSENLLWSVPLVGRGNSSPVVTDHDVFLTSQDANRDLWIVDIDIRTGKTSWQNKVGGGSITATGPASLYAHRQNAATPTPLTDGENVFAFFGTGDFVCLDYRGELVWRRSLVKDYGPFDLSFGMSSSPCWIGKELLLACVNKRSSYVIIMNPRYGTTEHKLGREYYAKADGRDAYSSPVVFDSLNPIVLVAAADTLDSHVLYAQPKLKSMWHSSSLGIESDHGRIIASPTVYENTIVVTTANPLGAGVGRVHALDMNSTGQGRVLWEYKKYTPDCSTPVCYKNRVYMVRDDGIASCLKLRTGELVWRKRLGKGPFHSSLVASDDKVYFLSRDGVCYVVAADNEGALLAENQLPGNFYATPAISNGVMYIRSDTHLYAIGRPAKQ